MLFKKRAFNDIAIGKDQRRVREKDENNVGIGGEKDNESPVHFNLRSLGDRSGTACQCLGKTHCQDLRPQRMIEPPKQNDGAYPRNEQHTAKDEHGAFLVWAAKLFRGQGGMITKS